MRIEKFKHLLLKLQDYQLSVNRELAKVVAFFLLPEAGQDFFDVNTKLSLSDLTKLVCVSEVLVAVNRNKLLLWLRNVPKTYLEDMVGQNFFFRAGLSCEKGLPLEKT